MTTVISGHPRNLPLQIFNSSTKTRLSTIQCLGCSGTEFHSAGTSNSITQQLSSNHGKVRSSRLVIVRAVNDEAESNNSKDDDKDQESEKVDELQSIYLFLFYFCIFWMFTSKTTLYELLYVVQNIFLLNSLCYLYICLCGTSAVLCGLSYHEEQGWDSQIIFISSEYTKW